MSVDDLPVMAPATLIGGAVRTGPNNNLDTDEVVVTFEALLMVPVLDDEDVMALFPLIMTPEVAESFGLRDTDPEEEQ